MLLELNQLDYVINKDQVDEGKGNGIPEFLQSAISKYGQIFKSPEGLPQRRDHEHAITLKEGSNPVSVRPYRYL